MVLWPQMGESAWRMVIRGWDGGTWVEVMGRAGEFFSRGARG